VEEGRLNKALHQPRGRLWWKEVEATQCWTGRGDGCGNSGGDSDSQQARGTVRIQSVAPVRAAGIAALGQSLRNSSEIFTWLSMKLQPRLGATNLYCTTVLNLFYFSQIHASRSAGKGPRRERGAGETWLAAAGASVQVAGRLVSISACVRCTNCHPHNKTKRVLSASDRSMSHLQFDRI